MKERLRSLGKLAWIMSALAVGALAIPGCQAGNAALRALNNAAQSMQASNQAQSSLADNDEQTRSALLVRQVVPIEERTVTIPVVHGESVQDLRPVASGPGVIVCEPSPVGSSQSVTDFASGCGDWLDLIVAGQPEFGKTPEWESLQRTREELPSPNLQLTPEQAYRLYQIVGVNYVVAGTVQGTPEHCTLSYQIYALPSNKPVGKPIVTTGSETAIVAQLPETARSMAVALGAPSPSIPASVGASDPEDLAFLGKIRHEADLSDLSKDQQDRLAALAQHVPTAGMLYTQGPGLNKEILMAPAIKTLFAQLPDNPLVYSHIGWQDNTDLLPYRQVIEAKYHQYPNNYLLATTVTWLARESFDAQEERDAAEQTVRCGWHNPEAWLTLAYTLSNEADAIRKGRWSSLISSTEWAEIDQIYPQWQVTVKRATELDPQDGGAWERLAVAATFNNNTKLADQAIQNALRLDPNRSEVYDWGLQMYEPQWSDATDQLAKMANRAAAEKYDSDNDVLDVYYDLVRGKCTSQASTLLEGYKAKLHKRIVHDPNDGKAHWSLAACYFHQQLFDQAIEEYKTAAKLLPNEPGIDYYLGQSYDNAGQIENATAAYQATLELDPDHHYAHYSLAYDLKREHRFDEALPEFQKALSIDPYFGNACYGLGELYDMENSPALAIPEYLKTIHYEPNLTEAYIYLANDLDNAGQYDQSLQVAYDGLLIDPEHNVEISVVEDDFLHKHQYDKAISVCNLVLKANVLGRPGQTNPAVTHENLAEAYIGKGDKAKAIAEWHTVLGYNDASMNSVARSFLAKYQ